MRLVAALILLLTLPCSVPADTHDDAVIRSARDLESAEKPSDVIGRRFELRGTVVYVINLKRFILDDGNGRTSVFHEHNVRFVPGDMCHVLGNIGKYGKRGFIAQATTVRKTGWRKPPEIQRVSIAQLMSGTHNLEHVTTQGIVVDMFCDEIDTNWSHLILRENGESLDVAFMVKNHDFVNIDTIIGSTIEVTGICYSNLGDWRSHTSVGLCIYRASDIHTVKSASDNIRDTVVLDETRDYRPHELLTMGSRRIDGHVIAVWDSNKFLIRTSTGKGIFATLAHGQMPPNVGDKISVCGYPETDLFSLRLYCAIWQKSEPSTMTPEKPTDLTAAQLFYDNRGVSRINMPCVGKLVRFSGIVRTLPSEKGQTVRLQIDSNGVLVPVETRAAAERMADISIGCRISVTGVFIVETESWSVRSTIPRILGHLIVLRSPEDIQVLTHPSWWTPGRLLVVVGTLFVLLLAILVWNRILNRLVERKSRMLLREQVARIGTSLKLDERTRLAVELHDALSQTLTGVSFQIDAAERARTKDPSQVGQFLAIAKRTLMSCREELRNCLWDLRNNALEEKNAENAIRRTVEPHLGEAALDLHFDVPRQKLTDSTFHAILRIVRELSVNAVRHGRATRVEVRGEMTTNALAFSVADNGCGFDATHVAGSDEGHFGLLGVAERVNTLGGRITTNSEPGKGTKIEITLDL